MEDGRRELNDEVQLIISKAVTESDKITRQAEEKAASIVKNAEFSASETREKLEKLKNSFSGMLNDIMDEPVEKD